jgi:hypothetical protein
VARRHGITTVRGRRPHVLGKVSPCPSVALNTWLGARIGRHLLGEALAPSFAEPRHRPIPLHRFRAAYLPAVGLWFRWQDRGFAPAG